MSHPVVESLRSAFESGVTRPLEWRQSQLFALRRLLTEREAELAAALRADLGKCLFDAMNTELGFVVKEIDHALKNLRRWTRGKRVATPLITMPGSSWIQPNPKGVVLIIGAWNYPVELLFSPLVAALAAGNAVLLKPSEVSARTSATLTELLPKYLDSRGVAIVEGGADSTQALLEESFGHILYTGNGQVGRIVLAAAAKHLTPVTLELGGKSPCIVGPDADLAVTAARLVWAKFMNAGQTCIAPDYVLAHRDVVQPLVAAIEQRLLRSFGTDPAQSADYGRIVNERHVARLQGYLQGHTVRIGGQSDAATRYFAPTVVLDPALDSKLMQEEIFGPILPIVPVDSMTAALTHVRQRPTPLSLYVFTKDAELQRRVVEELSSGSVCINDAIVFRAAPGLPFGGAGPSGMGRYGGWFGFETFSHMKAVMKRGFHFDVELRYPPYTDGKLSIMRRL